MSSLLLVPLDDTVVFPTMDVTLPVDAGDEERVLLIPRHDGEFAKVGTIAEVTDRVRLPGGGRAVTLSGVARGVAGAAHSDHAGRLRIEVTEHPDDVPVDGKTRQAEREYRATVEEILELRGADERVAAFLRAIVEPGALADTIGYAPDVTFEQKVQVLETLSVTERLQLAVKIQRERLTELQLRQKIREDVREGAEKQQREYFLRKQMESIQRELGEDSASVVEEYRTKIAEAGMPEAVEEQAAKELGRLERMGEQSGEASMIRSYLDWLIPVPWSERSEERLDPVVAREVLDADHAGLEDVKDRIVEYIAVKKLRVERGIAEDKRSGAILTLIGPPGTGKTSIGESIARATGREFVRMSLGGVRDEAEIRGHRRTYIGALPGRLARRPERGPPRGPRSGTEPLLPRPLPGRGARPVAGGLHRHRERGRDDPDAAARPDGDHPLRRLHDRREGRDRPRLPVAAAARAQRPARGRGDDRRRHAACRGHRVHPRGGRPQPGARAGHPAQEDGDQAGFRPGGGPRPDRRGRASRRPRQAALLPGGGRAHGCAGRGHRPGRDRRGRGRPLHRGDLDEGQGRPRADRPAGRRHEGVGANRPLLHARPRGRDRHRRGRLRRPRVPHAHPGRGDPEGRPERGHHDDDGAGVAPERPPGAPHRRHDRRGDAPGPRAADRRAQAEGAGPPRGRAPRRDPAGPHPRQS